MPLLDQFNVSLLNKVSLCSFPTKRASQKGLMETTKRAWWSNKAPYPWAKQLISSLSKRIVFGEIVLTGNDYHERRGCYFLTYTSYSTEQRDSFSCYYLNTLRPQWVHSQIKWNMWHEGLNIEKHIGGLTSLSSLIGMCIESCIQFCLCFSLTFKG